MDRTLKILEDFYKTEIGGRIETANIWLDWLHSGEQESLSGNAFFVEKTEHTVVIGNLFDEDYSVLEMLHREFENFILEKIEEAN